MLYLEENDKYIEYISKSVGIFPRFLNLELTSKCNLRCIMCPKTVGFHTHKPDNEISDIVLEKIIEQVLSSVYHINLMGFGEPLIAEKKLLSLLAECKKRHITVNMISNGQLLNADIVRKLVDLEIFNINISLDAATEGTYKKIRNSDFNRVIQNLTMLKKIKEEQKKVFPTIDLSFVGMIDNISELPDFIKIAHDVGARKVVLQALSEVPDSLVHEKDIFIHNREMGLDNYNKALMIASELGVEIELFPPDQFNTNRNESTKEHIIPESDGLRMIKDCIEPWNAVFISSEGGVSPCCGLPSMGDLNTSNFLDIWLGEKMTELRNLLKTDKIPQNCIYCRGAGWKKPTEVQEELKIGKDDGQLGLDWYSTDKNAGVQARWSGETGTYFIKRSGSPALIELESITKDSLLSFFIDDNKLFEAKMSGNSIIDSFYLEPTKIQAPQKNDQVVKITLHTNKIIKPADESGNDGRQLGIKFFSHSKLTTVNFDEGRTLVIGVSSAENNFVANNGWISISASIIKTSSMKESEEPCLFIHITKNNSFYKRILNRYFPDGLLRILNYLYSGSFNLKLYSQMKNGTKLNQYKLSWDKNLRKGLYTVYAGLWHPRTGRRIPIITDGKGIISKNRIQLGSFVIE